MEKRSGEIFYQGDARNNNSIAFSQIGQGRCDARRW